MNSNSEQSRQVQAHSEHLIDRLQERLLGATKGFKTALESRSSSMKAQEQRRSFFGRNRSLGKPMALRASTPIAATDGPPSTNPAPAEPALPRPPGTQASSGTGEGVQGPKSLRPSSDSGSMFPRRGGGGGGGGGGGDEGKWWHQPIWRHCHGVSGSESR